MKQDFLLHIHPMFTGHEFCTLDYIEAFYNTTNIPMVLTPHIDCPETDDNHYDGYDLRKDMINKLQQLSEKYDNIILGGEFTAQNIMLFKDSEIDKLTKVKILSFHDKLKFSKYIYDEDTGQADFFVTQLVRATQPWIYTNEFNSSDLLKYLEEVFLNFDIQVLGHINRDLNKMISPKPNKKELDIILDKILDLAKKYEVIIEINVCNKIEDNKKLIEKCIERNLKMVVGLDSHLNTGITPMNEYLGLIPEDNQVSFKELIDG